MTSYTERREPLQLLDGTLVDAVIIRSVRVEPSCTNCRFESLPGNEPPCNGCHLASEWAFDGA